MVNRLLLVSTVRHMQRHAWQTWLSVLGIAIGVAVIVAVDLANQSARTAFLLSAQSITGKATHQLTSSGQGIPENFYTVLRIEHGLRDLAPVVEGVLSHGAERLRILGIDMFAESPFRQFDAGLDGDQAMQMFTEPGSVMLSGITARRFGIVPGDVMDVTVGGRAATLDVIGLLEGDNPAALEGLVIADIATAQELLGRSGWLDRIDLVLQTEQAEHLQTQLPAGIRLEVPASRTRVMEEMIDAFQVNLTAMSLLAILVGAFLIYNTMTFSVLRRRRMFATLRIVGAIRSSLLKLLFLEASLLALLGTLIGLGLGVGVAHFLIHLVTRTINDLYFVLTVTQLFVDPLILLKGSLIGIGMTLLAAALPAIDAARTEPVNALRHSQLEQKTHRLLPWLLVTGFVLLLTGLWIVELQGMGLMTGFTGLFVIIFGYSLLIPAGVVGLGRLGIRFTRKRRMPVRLAMLGLDANLSRTGLAVASLSVAVAATLGVSIMITSFRDTVSDWLGYTLRSDVYMSALSEDDRVADELDLAAILDRVASVQGVVEVSNSQRAMVATHYGDVELIAIQMATQSQKGFRFIEPPVTDVWSQYRSGKVVLVSEPFAYRHALATGDRLSLQSPSGTVELTIGGIFYDYGSDQGLVSIDRLSYARYWQDNSIATLGIFLQPGTDPSAFIERLRDQLPAQFGGVMLRSSGEIRAHSMQVFDRTFAITRVLRMLAIGVAFIGVLSALMALQLERRREQAVLRATGMTPKQVFRMTLLQTGLMGIMAGVLSLPLGWLMSDVLIDVINRRAFGWSIATQLPPGALIDTILLALVAALLAGLYPAWRMSRVEPALALREE